MPLFMNRLGQLRFFAAAATKAVPIQSINGPSSRRFDSHTWSIWAQQMAKRGNVEDAVRMLENAVAERKIPSDQAQVLFNTAINICGHEGKYNRAWGLFNDVPSLYHLTLMICFR